MLQSRRYFMNYCSFDPLIPCASLMVCPCVLFALKSINLMCLSPSNYSFHRFASNFHFFSIFSQTYTKITNFKQIYSFILNKSLKLIGKFTHFHSYHLSFLLPPLIVQNSIFTTSACLFLP